jgi:multidrug efflux pump
VLAAVFVPSALQPGATGIIYSQFALTIAVSMLFSAFLALSFTPSLCAALLKPAHHASNNLVFRWFNRGFDRFGAAYVAQVGRAVRRVPRWMVVFVMLAALAGVLYTHLPTAFVPDEDQGVVLAIVNLPSGSSLSRTDAVMEKIRNKLTHSPLGKDIDGMFAVEGYSFVGQSENVGMIFIKLTDWSKRSQTAMQLIPQANKLLHGIDDAQIFVTNLPTIRGLSQFSGVDMYLQARAGQPRDQLAQAQAKLLTLANHDPRLFGIRPNSLPQAPQLDIAVDRTQAQTMGLSLPDVYNTISMDLAPVYVNEFTYGGRVKRVYLQADAPFRMGPDAFEHMYTPSGLTSTAAASGSGGSVAGVSSSGAPSPVNPSVGNSAISPYNMVPLSSVVSTNWHVGPQALPRFNGYSAVEIVGAAAPGYSSGQAMDALQNIVNSLPTGFASDWTGQSYQEVLAGNSATMLMALSVVVVFLCLAALYESWSIPVAVLLAVPLGLLGMAVFGRVFHIPNDIYFKIGMVTVIGLAAKNAILIVEFAIESQQKGMTLFDAVMSAARLRFRPIVMTSLAFIVGAVPLVTSSGAGAASRHEIGAGVIGGMLFATVFGLMLIPVFYVTVRRLLGDKLDEITRRHVDPDDVDHEEQAEPQVNA